jgi:hypothetical protein
MVRFVFGREELTKAMAEDVNVTGVGVAIFETMEIIVRLE